MASPDLLPLSEDEFSQLSEWLDLGSPFDIHGLLGLLYAVSVAPSSLPPSEWLPLVLTPECGDLPAEKVQSILGLIFRLHSSVLDAVGVDQWMLPDPDEVEDCDSFATGFVAAAELDPEWLGDAGRWALVAPLAYLAERDDLMSVETIEQLVKSAAPGDDPAASIRENLPELVSTINDTLREARSMLTARAAASRAPGPSSAGRNDPCPCGSGKKYKRCCIDGATAPKAQP